MSLFSPATLGAIPISNRLILSPTTRRRAESNGTPSSAMVEYYAQRASFGLVVTESVFVTFEGQAYSNQPGIVTAGHRAGWRRVTDAVHKAGGRVVIQLHHAGLGAVDEVEVPSLIEGFTDAARGAIEAGADGVEVHGGNAGLLHQLHAANLNRRTDGYGGSPEERARTTVEVVTSVADVIGADHTALRISPRLNHHGIDERDDDDTTLTYQAIVNGIAPLGTAYLSYLPDVTSVFAQDLRRRYRGAFVVNTGMAVVTAREQAMAIIDDGYADAVAVGRAGIANPDLVRRWRENRELNAPRPELFYGGGSAGYTDYPMLSD